MLLKITTTDLSAKASTTGDAVSKKKYPRLTLCEALPGIIASYYTGMDRKQLLSLRSPLPENYPM